MTVPAITIAAPNLTPRQRDLISSRARILWIGCGTKTGKTVALVVWQIEGLLAGENVAWVGPWFQRSRTTYEIAKSLLKPFIQRGEIICTDGNLRIKNIAAGSSMDFFSGDNPDSLFGGNYSRVVLDEASRMPEKVLAAALTIISATRGKLRCAFNVELGSRNWAVRNLLRVQGMTPGQRQSLSEDAVTFPTLTEGLVDSATIEAFRHAMPLPLWEALYLAKIPESDTSLFRNLDRVFTGQELDAPAEGRSYVAGVDLGRKRDYSVVTIIDAKSHAVAAMDRFHEISWSLQVSRAAALYKKFHCSKAVVDATGLGDPVVEELEKAQLRVKPFIFTQSSRKEILENLIVACDGGTITIPATEKFKVYRQEMESFEFVLDGNSIKYAAPEHMHDDAAISLALALHATKHATFELGLLALQTWASEKFGFSNAWENHIEEYEADPESVTENQNVKTYPPAIPANQGTCPTCLEEGRGPHLMVKRSGNWLCPQCAFSTAISAALPPEPQQQPGGRAAYLERINGSNRFAPPGS